jgi:XTP/dITP diphosphohydrolase
MKSFLLASGNAHKAQEFAELFKDTLNITPAPQTLAVDETGTTFIENALLKARAYAEAFKAPALADDSGLVLEAMPELLGVQSARFAPELPDYQQKCRRLLELMQESANRRAYFVCVLCFYISPTEVFFFEGRVHGKIGTEIKGEHGFGYDPIFIPDRKEQDELSLAQLPQWKNHFSHRAKAAQSALEFFKESMDKISK